MALDPTTALSLARDAYSASTTYFDSSIRKEVEADIRRFQNMHPTGSKYLSEAYRAKSRIFRPKVRTMITKHEAVAAEAFFANRDVTSIEPQDDNDPVQKASAALHKELLQYRLTKTIPWFLLVMGAYQESMNLGIVCSYQHWVFDKKKGKDQPDIRLLPIENVRFDPGASWLDPVNTSPYFIELIPMYVKDVRARMQQADPKTGEIKWKPLDDGAILAAMRGYSDSIRLQREQGRQDSKENVSSITSYSIVWVHKNIVEYDGDDYCYYTLADQQLLSDPVLLKDRYHHGKRPYVIGYSSIEAHKNYPAGPNRKSKDLAAEINEIANQRIENIKLALNKRYLVQRNRQVDIRSLTRNVAGSATLVQDTEKDVKELEFNDVTASSYKEQEVLSLEFDETTGNFSTASVQANRATNETAEGMQLVKDDSNVLSSYQLRVFAETWMEPVLRQLVLLEQAYETDEVILALAGQKAKLDELGFDAIDDELIEQELILSVNVGFGPTSPTQKLNRFLTAMRSLKELVMDNALQGYGLKFDEVCSEVFAALGYKDGSRFFDMGHEDPRVAQLQAQIQQLQQALDAKHPPELIDAQVREINAQIAALEPKNKLVTAQAVKTGVDASFSAMQAAEVVAAVPQAAPVADALMQGAGYELPIPPGVDPNIPTAGAPNSEAAAVAPAGGLSTQPIKNNRDGMVTTLPGSGQPGGPAAGDTSPNTPANAGGAGGMPLKPQSPGTGAERGIETMRSDSGMRDGGLVTYDDDGTAGAVDRRSELPGGKNSFGAFAEFGGISSHPMSAFLARDNAQNALDTNRQVQQAHYDNAVARANPPAPAAPNLGSGAYAPPYAGAAPTTISNVAKAPLLTDPLGTGTYGLHDDLLSFRDGGQIVGPGSGTSDSIAAQTQDGTPLAVSNGEYKIPAQVVAVLGADFFDKLISEFHQPTAEAPPQASGPPALGVETGSVIIPADVVAALGKDFFDRLVAVYGGAQ